MKRAFPQKVRLGTYQISNGADLVGGPATKVFANGNRRTRTSAAMVGLALSMGASSLLVPRHDDGAAAAEARTSESTVAQLPESFQIAASSTEADTNLVGDFVEHVVEPGQTLWRIAQRYKVPVEVIAIANDLSEDEPIRVGQRLRIPGASPVAAAPQGELAESSTLVASTVPTVSPSSFQESIEADRTLQAEQDAALEKLAQHRQQLTESLTALNSISTDNPSTNARKLEQSDRQARQQSIVATPSPEPTPLVQQPTVPTVPAPESLPAPEPTATVNTPIAESYQEEIAVAALPEQSVDRDAASESVAVSPEALESTEVEPVTSVIYRVAPGDTVSNLARKYNVSVSQLVAENGISNPNYIFVGQSIRVPVSADVESEVSTVPPTLVAQSVDSELSLARAPETTVQPDVVEDTAPPQVSVVPQNAQVEQSLDTAAPVPAASNEIAYVDNLLQEIRVMSDRYRNATPEVTTTVPSAALENSAEEQLQIGLAEPITEIPDAVSTPSLLAASPTSATVSQSSTQISVTTQTAEPVVSPVRNTEPVDEESELVAVAPLGSENYQPLLEPITGRMVSPDLPPLPAADEFLPDSPAAFNGYIWPAQGQLTSGYGWRWGRMHNGIDIAAPIGTPIYSAAPGVVEYAGWNSGGYGNMIEVRHADGSMTRYAHLDSIAVSAGQEVDQGEQIGEMGSTGYSTGPHLHFEVHLAQGSVNPIAYLP